MPAFIGGAYAYHLTLLNDPAAFNWMYFTLAVVGVIPATPGQQC